MELDLNDLGETNKLCSNILAFPLEYFRNSTDGKYVICKFCDSVFQTGDTSAMTAHLCEKHKITYEEVADVVQDESDICLEVADVDDQIIENCAEDYILNYGEQDTTSENVNEHEYAKTKNEAQRERMRRCPCNVGAKLIDADFKFFFKMSRTSFDEFVSFFRDKWTDVKGRAAIRIEIGFQLFLWTLIHQESFKEVSDRFDVGKGNAHVVFVKACRLLYNNKKHFIQWPNIENMKKIVKGFSSIENSFPGVIGCLGKTHISVPGYSMDESYNNYDGYTSIQVQAVCDDNFMFTNVYVGWPGSAENSLIWHHNPLNKLLKESDLPENFHLIADTSFPLSTYLMRPYKESLFLTRRQLNFNTKLNGVRCEIDRAFVALKSAFKKMQNVTISKIELAKYFIMAGFIVHNFILSKNESISFIEDEMVNETSTTNECFLVYDDKNAIAKRDNIAEQLPL